MKKRIIVGIVLGLLLSACNSEPKIDVEATVSAALSATQTAVPTNTPVPPTDTPIPTNTPVPTDTPTPEPTDTPIPTNTPEPTSTPTPEPNMIQTTLESGDILYKYPKPGFSFTLSPDWLVVDLESEDLTGSMSAVGEQNESLSFLTTDYAQSLIATGMKFYAINTSLDSLRSGTPISVNVISEEVPVGITYEQYLAIVLGQLEQVFDLEGQINQSQAVISDQEFAMLSYTIEIVNDMGVQIESNITQYIILHNETAYIISLSILTELMDAHLESARAAVETFHFLDQ